MISVLDLGKSRLDELNTEHWSKNRFQIRKAADCGGE